MSEGNIYPINKAREKGQPADANGLFCGGAISDESAPEMKRRLGAELEDLGLPLYEVAADNAAEGMAEVSRLLEKDKQA